MPDHFHALLTPGTDVTLEKAMIIKGGSAHRIRKENLYRWPVWAEGFHDRWIRNASEYQARLGYIDSNPVVAGLAERSIEFPFCSISGMVAMDSSVFDKKI